MKKTRLRRLGRHNLPEELLAEILSRLPVKSLLRFRCVSKSWRALINDPAFARSHLLRFPNNRHQTHLLISEEGQSRLAVRSTTSLKITIASRILLADMPAGDWRVISSADGLFLLRSSYPTRTTMLWNPATRQTLIVPPCPKVDGEKSVVLGLGFGPLVNDDYKHVKLLYTKQTQVLHSIAVYSLATNSWKIITRFEQVYQWWPFQPREPPILFLKGALFFLATKTNTPDQAQLVSFDLRSEAFSFSTELPMEDHQSDDDPPLLYGPFSADDTECSSLAVVYLWPTKGSGSVWTLEGLGGGDDGIEPRTWSKRYTFASMIPEFDSMAGTCNLFYLRKNGEMLLQWKRMITSYDLKSHKEKIVLRKTFGSKAWPYMESLVMLK